MTLKFLGRGSMFNVKEGNTSAYWKDRSGRHMVLIDCGCTVFSKIEQLNLLDGVDNLLILLTHPHTDHIGSLSDLLHYCVFVKPKMSVTVLVHKDTVRSIRQYLDCTGTTIAMKNSNVKIRSIVGEASITDDLEAICKVEFIVDRTHVVPQPTPKGGVESCGILLKLPNKKRIYYSGDTMSPPYQLLDLERIDELYVDCAVRTNSPGSTSPYPHYNLYKMISDLNGTMYPLDQVYAMHLDCDGVIFECEQMGINLVKVEGE